MPAALTEDTELTSIAAVKMAAKLFLHLFFQFLFTIAALLYEIFYIYLLLYTNISFLSGFAHIPHNKF